MINDQKSSDIMILKWFPGSSVLARSSTSTQVFERVRTIWQDKTSFCNVQVNISQEHHALKNSNHLHPLATNSYYQSIYMINSNMRRELRAHHPVPEEMPTLDLHGYTKCEAIRRTTEFLDRANTMMKNSKPAWVQIITGKGNHSSGGRKLSRDGFPLLYFTFVIYSNNLMFL